jgi:pyruvate/2-oxoglutarate dehydrogenase complex dihydrolipoamide acyltransferase (E2) component
MEEGAIVKWVKNEGDTVAKGDILFEIETDKANLEVESFFEGTLIKIIVREGITVPVNTVVGYIGEKGEKVPDTPPPAAAPAPAAKAEAPAPAPSAVPAAANCGCRQVGRRPQAPPGSGSGSAVPGPPPRTGPRRPRGSGRTGAADHLAARPGTGPRLRH